MPPRSIYAEPVPRNVPTVKSCELCNVGASQDDEYFRDVIVKYRRVADLPQAQQQIDAMVRAAGKPAKRKYAEATMRAFVDIEVRTRKGLVLGTAPAYRVDGQRLYRAVARYVRGLHRLELGARVPDGATITVGLEPERIFAATDEVHHVFSGAPRRVVQEGVFWYAWMSPRDRPEASAWLLVFFDAFPLLGFVHPPRAAAPNA